MKIEIDEQAILSGILERDERLHSDIKRKVHDDIVEQVTSKIEAKYIQTDRWDTTRVEADILCALEEKQTALVKKVLKEFYDSYRYKKSDLEILKKLKDFLGEN